MVISTLDFLGKGSSISKVFYFISFLILVSFAGFRYDTGWDYATYRYYFNMTPSLFDLLNGIGWDTFHSIYFEPGFKVIISIFNELGFSFQSFLFLCNFITLILIFSSFNFFYKYFPYRNIMVFIYYATAYLLLNMSVIRQGIVCGILLYSMRFLINKQWIKYLFCILVGALFHITVIIFLILPFIYVFNFSFLMSLIIICLSLIIFLMKIQWLGFIIDNVLPFLSYKYHTYISNNFYNHDRGLSFGFFEKLIFIMVFAYLYYFKGKNNRILKLFYYNYLFYFMSYLLFFEIGVIYSRLRLYFVMLFIINLLIIIKYLSKESRIIGFIFICIYSFIIFYSQVRDPATIFVYSPYHSIFDDSKEIPSYEKGYERVKMAFKMAVTDDSFRR